MMLSLSLFQGAAEAEDLVVSQGEEQTLTTNCTYGTVTVNGTLSVPTNVTLTYTDSLRIADGAGASGSVVVNGGRIYSAEGTVYVGHDGGNGTLRIVAGGSSARFVEIGHGAGADGLSVFRFEGGTCQSRYVTKSGDGVGRVVFAGPVSLSVTFGYVFRPMAGTLELESENANISASYSSEGEQLSWLFSTEDGMNGRVVTRGTGRVVAGISANPRLRIALNRPAGGVDWGHAGGFALSGPEGARFLVKSSDFFLTNDLPAAVSVNLASLDICGLDVPIASVAGTGVVTNSVKDAGSVVVGTDNGNLSVDPPTCVWSESVPLRKVGSGVMTLTGFSLPMPLTVAEGKVLVPTNQLPRFCHYRFVVDEGMGSARNSIQISEIRLLCEDGGVQTDVTSLRSGITWGDGANDREASAQSPAKAFDGSFSTKWLTMKTGAYNATAADKSNCWVQVDFARPQTVTHLDWATAGDCSNGNYTDCRNPMKWRLLGSDDGEHWTLLDARDIGKKAFNINSWTGPYAATLPADHCISLKDIRLEGGILDVGCPTQCGSVSQVGGQLKIDTCGRLLFAGETWTNPSFTDDSTGAVEKVGDGAAEIRASSVAFRGDASILGGCLQICRYADGQTTDRLFRFTIKKTYSDAACTQLSRFRLLDEDGNVLSDGLTLAAAGTDPKLLPAGQCCYAESYSQGGSSSLKNLFDGNTGTKMCLTSLSMGNADVSKNTWRTFYFRLADNVTAPAVAYQMTTANDNTPGRNPSVWSLESSADGETWTVLDARTSGEFANPTTTYADFNDGTPLALRDAVRRSPTDAVTFPSGCGLSVASSCTLTPLGNLPIDALSGNGQVDGDVTVGAFGVEPSATGLQISGRLTIGAIPEFRLAGFTAPTKENPETTAVVAEAASYVGAENLSAATFVGLPEGRHVSARAFIDDGKLKVTVYREQEGVLLIIR